jgi:micrococcal nuclease
VRIDHYRAGLTALLLAAALPAAAMDFCSGPKRVTCVVDGDTFWLNGEKVRIMDIDAPEMGGACLDERQKSAAAAARLAELLSSGDIELQRQGKDFHKRTLAIVLVGGQNVGSVLIAENLARPWKGKRENWCAPLKEPLNLPRKVFEGSVLF